MCMKQAVDIAGLDVSMGLCTPLLTFQIDENILFFSGFILLGRGCWKE